VSVDKQKGEDRQHLTLDQANAKVVGCQVEADRYALRVERVADGAARELARAQASAWHTAHLLWAEIAQMIAEAEMAHKESQRLALHSVALSMEADGKSKKAEDAEAEARRIGPRGRRSTD
jgi:hypothetical protein